MQARHFMFLLVLTLAITGTAFAGLNDGLVAYYPFNGNAYDASGNGHHGVVSGAALTTDRHGQPNSAYSFDGIDDVIMVRENGDFNVGNGLTVSLWIRFQSEPACLRPTSFVSKSAVPPVGRNSGYIFPYINFTDCNSFGLIVNTRGDWSWDFRRSFSYFSIQEPLLWHLYTATYDGAARRMYLDGELVSVDYQAGLILPNSNDLAIGNQPGTGEWAHAEMDEVRIYRRALSEQEIRDLYLDPGSKTSCIQPPSGMIGWWPGDGNAVDVVGGNNGTPQNNAAFNAGMVGRAFNFEGVDDYVNLGNPDTLKFGNGDFTVDAWVFFNATAGPGGLGVPSGDMAIVDKMLSSGIHNENGWRLLKQDDNRFWFCFGLGNSNGCTPGGPTTVQSASVITPDVWYHVAAVRAGNTISLYVNGVNEAQKTLEALPVNTDLVDLLFGMHVIDGAPGVPTSFLNGLLDEVEIFNRALTVKEIKSIYTAGSAGKCKNRPPVASAGIDQTAELTSCAGASVTLDGSGSSDTDGDTLAYSWSWPGGSASGVNPTVALPYGTTTLTLTVDDGKGGTSTDEVVVSVVDTTAPVLNVSLSPKVLWPPNHKYVTATPSVAVEDACVGATVVELLSATSNDPDNGPGDGDAANDIVINSNGTLSLRSERSGTGTGRIYTITYRAIDPAGNSSIASTIVTVPHDRGGRQ